MVPYAASVPKSVPILMALPPRRHPSSRLLRSLPSMRSKRKIFVHSDSVSAPRCAPSVSRLCASPPPQLEWIDPLSIYVCMQMRLVLLPSLSPSLGSPYPFSLHLLSLYRLFCAQERETSLVILKILRRDNMGIGGLHERTRTLVSGNRKESACTTIKRHVPNCLLMVVS